MSRNIKTVYYGAAGPGERKPVVRVTRGSRIAEALPNVARMLTGGRWAADVAEVTDEEYGELLFVVSYFSGENLTVLFEHDVTRPVCIVTGLGES